MILVEIPTTTSPVHINPDHVSSVGGDATATPTEVRHTLTQESF